jgi:hypothetical protein
MLLIVAAVWGGRVGDSALCLVHCWHVMHLPCGSAFLNLEGVVLFDFIFGIDMPRLHQAIVHD